MKMQIFAVCMVSVATFIGSASALSAPTSRVEPVMCSRSVFPIQTVHRALGLDGDTISVTLDLGMDVLRTTHIRLADADAWEIRGEQAPKGKLAEQAAHTWLAARAGRLEFVDRGDDKYGGRRDGIIRDASTHESLGVFLKLNGHIKTKD